MLQRHIFPRVTSDPSSDKSERKLSIDKLERKLSIDKILKNQTCYFHHMRQEQKERKDTCKKIEIFFQRHFEPENVVNFILEISQDYVKAIKLPLIVDVLVDNSLLCFRKQMYLIYNKWKHLTLNDIDLIMLNYQHDQLGEEYTDIYKYFYNYQFYRYYPLLKEYISKIYDMWDLDDTQSSKPTETLTQYNFEYGLRVLKYILQHVSNEEIVVSSSKSDVFLTASNPLHIEFLKLHEDRLNLYEDHRKSHDDAPLKSYEENRDEKHLDFS